MDNKELETAVENRKSIKINMILNAIKGIMAVLFPLITFPYASRILGVEGIGKYNFSNSIISYFLLLAGLGIANYARREGSEIRKQKLEFNQFASEVFSINLITTVGSYVVLGISLLISAKLQDYSNLILILSSTVALTTVGVEWLYSIFEDYLYITIRSIAFQFLSLVLLFVFVHSPDDLNRYAWITVVSSAGSNLLNFIHSYRYCSIKFTMSINWKKHMPPILVFFATAVSTTIYISSDVTVLGILKGDYDVGLYSVSVKIYNIVKNIISSVIVVSIPRLCAYEGQGEREKFISTAHDVFQTIITATLPALTGICLYSKEIVQIVGGMEYQEAYSSLSLLAVALLFCMFSYFWWQCVLVPLHKEKMSLVSAVISALLNLCLNFILIPLYSHNAAAFTTILAEGVAMLIAVIYSRKHIKLPSVNKVLLKTVIGCLLIILIALMTKYLIQHSFIRLVLGASMSIIIYFAVELLLKNESVTFIVKRFKRKGRSQR